MLEFLKSYFGAIKNLILVALIVFLCFCTWFFTKTYYQKIIAQSQEKQDEAITRIQSKQLENEHLAGEQHAKDQLTINQLSSQLNSLHIRIPSMQSSCSKDSNGTSGLASARIEEYLDEAKREIDAIAVRCSQLNLDAIQANESQSQRP